MWKERNKRAFDEVDDVVGFDLLKNRWLQTFDLLLLGHPHCTVENLENFIDTLTEL